MRHCNVAGISHTLSLLSLLLIAHSLLYHAVLAVVAAKEHACFLPSLQLVVFLAQQIFARLFAQ